MVVISKDSIHLLRHGDRMTTYVYFVRGSKHAALCRTSVESVRKVDPTAHCIVMTDDPINKPWYLDIPTYYIQTGLPIMLANLEAQVSAMFVVNPDEPIVFLDTDILLLQKIPALADLTITWRDYVLIKDEEKVEGIAAQMPYNYGIMVANHGIGAMEALIFMRERIRKMHSKHQDWYGNQLALAELAGPRPIEGMQYVTRRIPWQLTSQGRSVSIAKLPGEQWNWTPQKASDDLAGKGVLHFKGAARSLMETYAHRLGIPWYTEADVTQKEAA